MSKKNYLIFDIGGSQMRYALMNEDEMLLVEELPTPQESRQALYDLLIDIYQRYQVAGVAVSMPGIIDPVKGICYMGGALRYNDGFAIKDELSKVIKEPVVIENNARCAALAEARQGSLKDVEDGMALYFDYLIGSGLIRHHQLVRGAHCSTGEVAYMITVRNDMPDFDTLWGHRNGMPRLCAMYARVKGLKESDVTLEYLFNDVEEGDMDAIAVVDTFTREVAVQIFNLQTVLDVERFAIGGKVSHYDHFIEAIKTNLGELYAVCPYDIPSAEVVRCVFEKNASLIGAFTCLLDFIKAQVKE